MLYEFRKDVKRYGHNEVNRKYWIKNWQEQLLWEQYFDVDIYYVEMPITKYCEANGIDFDIDCNWLHCICNRKQYNDIMKICDEVLYEKEAQS